MVRRAFIPAHWLTDFGGLHENVLDTAAALLVGGWEVVVMAPASKSSAKFILAGATVLESAMTDVEADVALALANGPYHLVHAHPFQARRIGIRVAEECRIPAVITIHGQYDDEFNQYSDSVKHIICVSSRVANFISDSCPGISGKLVVIPNGVDFETFFYSARKRSENAPTVLALTSRLDPDKEVLSQAVGDLIEYLSGHEKSTTAGRYEIRIAGDRFYGPQRNSFIDAIDLAASSANIELVTAGWISDRSELRKFFSSADVVIAPGRAAMEAVACGIPTIAAGSRGYIGLVCNKNLSLACATNFGGVREAGTLYARNAIIRDFESALTVSAFDNRRLSEELRSSHDLKEVGKAHLDLALRCLSL